MNQRTLLRVWLLALLPGVGGAARLSAQSIYVSNASGGVSVVSRQTLAVVASIPVTGGPAGLALTPGGQALYVAQAAASSVAVVDTGSNTLVATVPVGQSPLGVAAAPNGLAVYVANSASNSVSVISTATNAVVATVMVGPSPTVLAVAPDSRRVFVAGPISGISVISAALNEVTANWPAAPGVDSLALSPDGGTLYVANRATSRIALYDTVSGIVSKTVGGLSYPDSIAVTPSGGALYVTNGSVIAGGSSVSKLSASSLETVATVAVPAGPTFAAVSPAGSEVYVVSQRTGSLSVISTQAKAVVKILWGMGIPVAVAAAAPAAPVDLCSAADTGLPPLTGVLPALPQSCYQPQFPTPTSTVSVSTAQQLQAALGAAACGEGITVAPGTYLGNFTAPQLQCPSTQPVLLVNGDLSYFPAFGTTYPPQSLAGGPHSAVIESNNNSAAFTVELNTSGFYAAGIEFTTIPPAYVYPIVAVGEGNVVAAAQPSYVTFDRCLVHAGEGTAFVRGGIDLMARYGTVMFSNIWDITNVGQDTQAIAVMDTTGPLFVVGNYLEATGENIQVNVNCTPPATTCPPNSYLIPSDITLRLNHFVKLAAWRNAPAGCCPANAPSCPTGAPPCYDVKTLLEWKMAQRVLVDSNIFDTVFAEGQAGEVFIANCGFGQVGDDPFFCSDATFTNNLIKHAGVGPQIAGNGDGQTARYLFRNNIAIDISADNWGNVGGLTGVAYSPSGAPGMRFDHNTWINEPSTVTNILSGVDLDPGSLPGFQETNSMHYGTPFATGMVGGSVVAGMVGATWGGDLFVGDYWPNIYPAGPGSPAMIYQPPYPQGITTVDSPTQPAGSAPCDWSEYWPPTGPAVPKSIAACWPLDWGMVGFLDFAGGSAGTNLAGLAIAPGSLYHNAGTDGLDIGANVAAVLSAVSTVQ
jgi:YVTN family beta-propeller protein